MVSDIIQVLMPAGAAFAIGIGITPTVAHFLYKYKAWKKTPGKLALDGSSASEFNRLHEGNEVRAPRMGGVIIWISVILTALLVWILSTFSDAAKEFNFVSRNQTWIPIATLIIGSLIGLFDDLLVIRPGGTGLRLRYRLFLVVAMSLFIGFWFFSKLDVTAVNVPFADPLEIGWFIVPFFIITSLALYASGVIDGIDGLSGGVFSAIFAAYAVIAFAQNQIDLAAFCATVVGGTLAFLWFNVPPARFYMSDTGTMGLTLTVAVVAFMTDNLGGGVGIAVLPIIGFLLVVTVASNILQVVWKKMYGVKLLRIAPLHHHFEAIGWPGYKVVMRYWILSVVFASLGIILALASF